MIKKLEWYHRDVKDLIRVLEANNESETLRVLLASAYGRKQAIEWVLEQYKEMENG